jgi:acyl-CoA thioester hydrolase
MPNVRSRGDRIASDIHPPVTREAVRVDVYFDVALTELWCEALGSYTALTADGLDLVAETGARFHAPARFDDELKITLETKHLGNTSMVSAVGIVREGNTLADGRIVHIFFRADRLGEKAPIPDHVRRAL